MSSPVHVLPYTVEERPDTGLFNAKLGIWLFLASEVMLFGGLFSSYILLRVNAVDWPLGSTILSIPIGTFNTMVLITSSVTMVMAWASLKMHRFNKYLLYLGLTIFLALTFLMVKAFEYGAKFEIEYNEHFPVLYKTVIGSAINGFASAGMMTKSIWGGVFLIVVLVLGKIAIKDFAKFLRYLVVIAGIFIFGCILLTLFELGNRHSHHNFPPSHNTYMAIYFTLTGLHGIHVIGGIIVNSYFWGAGRRMWLDQPERFTNRIEIAGLYWHFVDLVWIFLFPVLYLL